MGRLYWKRLEVTTITSFYKVSYVGDGLYHSLESVGRLNRRELERMAHHSLRLPQRVQAEVTGGS